MKNLKEYLLCESINDNVIDYFKKTFKNITIEDRNGNEFPNPFSENGDWVEVLLNDFDPITSFAYDPNNKLFQLVVDSCYVIYNGGDISFDDDGGEGYDATPENLKLYDKSSIEKICAHYENEY